LTNEKTKTKTLETDMVNVKKDITDIKNNYATIVKLDSEITSVNAKILTTESDLKL